AAKAVNRDLVRLLLADRLGQEPAVAAGRGETGNQTSSATSVGQRVREEAAADNSGDRKHGSRWRGSATGPVSMGNHRFPPPKEAASAAFRGGRFPRSMD
ncbi:unnamed protein product, partial [Prorocentrum cordatum]